MTFILQFSVYIKGQFLSYIYRVVLMILVSTHLQPCLSRTDPEIDNSGKKLREMGKEYVNGEVEKIRWSSSPSSNQEEEELPLLSLNHVSYVCKSLAASVKFYEDVLGFVLVKRPSSFDFEGAWYILLSPFPQ